MSTAGWLTVVGTGPGDPAWLTPESATALSQATDLVGYERYVDRVAGADQRRHVSDNREEMARARHALDLAASGARVALVSGGDPGIFAMAAAVWEAVDAEPEARWAGVTISVVPAVSAIQAVAARAGAPLGNDFCVISLSDNLKPWSVIEKRVALAAEADFAMAFYNPVSRARPWQLGAAIDQVARHRDPHTPVVIGTAIGRADEALRLTDLGRFASDQADMRTLVIIGASTTRRMIAPDGREQVYTPRYYPASS